MIATENVDLKSRWGSLAGRLVAPEVRDRFVDDITELAALTELPIKRLVVWARVPIQYHWATLRTGSSPGVQQAIWDVGLEVGRDEDREVAGAQPESSTALRNVFERPANSG